MTTLNHLENENEPQSAAAVVAGSGDGNNTITTTNSSSSNGSKGVSAKLSEEEDDVEEVEQMLLKAAELSAELRRNSVHDDASSLDHEQQVLAQYLSSSGSEPVTPVPSFCEEETVRVVHGRRSSAEAAAAAAAVGSDEDNVRIQIEAAVKAAREMERALQEFGGGPKKPSHGILLNYPLTPEVSAPDITFFPEKEKQQSSSSSSAGVKWEKVDSAVVGDDDYAEIVDYSKLPAAAKTAPASPGKMAMLRPKFSSSAAAATAASVGVWEKLSEPLATDADYVPMSDYSASRTKNNISKAMAVSDKNPYYMASLPHYHWRRLRAAQRRRKRVRRAIAGVASLMVLAATAVLYYRANSDSTTVSNDEPSTNNQVDVTFVGGQQDDDAEDLYETSEKLYPFWVIDDTTEEVAACPAYEHSCQDPQEEDTASVEDTVAAAAALVVKSSGSSAQQSTDSKTAVATVHDVTSFCDNMPFAWVTHAACRHRAQDASLAQKERITNFVQEMMQ